MNTPTERFTNIREIKAGSFIFERPLALSPAFCDEVIERFEAHPEQQYAGRIGQLRVAERVKSTTDLVVSNKEDWKDVDRMFFRSLAVAMQEFRDLSLLQGAVQGHRLPDTALPCRRVLPLAPRWGQSRVQSATAGRALVSQRCRGARRRDPVSLSGRKHPTAARQADSVSPLLGPRAPGGGAAGGGQVHCHHLGRVCLRPVLPLGDRLRMSKLPTAVIAL